MKILITGASGFIGSFIAEEALSRGLEVWVAVRKSTNRKYLKDERINFLELNLGNVEQLKTVLADHTFDYVVHAAGATKCIKAEDFFKVNTEGTKNFVNALKATNQPMKRFVYLSSLSVFGAIREKMPHTEILDTDTPQPNTAYGKSKYEAEKWLFQQDNLPLVVLRPTGVYGPRETDYFLMAKSIKGHSDFAVGYDRQDITFIYVKDLVQAVFKSMEHPIWVLRIVTAVGDRWMKMTGKMSALNNDKFNILKQRNWMCDITPAKRDMDFKPEYNLERGVKEAITWYKENGWL